MVSAVIPFAARCGRPQRRRAPRAAAAAQAPIRRRQRPQPAGAGRSARPDRLARACRLQSCRRCSASALLVGIWALLTMKGGSLPDAGCKPGTRPSKLFADPFYRNGPNDQGIGWNILFSLQRVAWASAWRRWSAFRWAS